MAREQRRLAAILAADVVGYSRLMGRDESGTLARLKAHRTERLEPTLARHGGRLVKLTGDGALAEFSSAVDALTAAIEFQQAMADTNRDQGEDTAIVFRVGLHLGDLIVDGHDLYGDGVNIAARLEAESPAGGIVISGNVRDAIGGRLKATFHDLGNPPLKNIERPVHAFRVSWDARHWRSPAAVTSVSSPSFIELLPPLPDKPSIAVLPFQNISGDPEQGYFADGVTDDIITALSRFKSLFVIARNSSFTYRSPEVDIRQVGRELGVRYLLQGSLRKAGQRVRITAQLIEGETGAFLWTEQFEGLVEDTFDLQDQITEAVASTLEPTILGAEILRMRRRPNSLGAYECYLRSLALTDIFTREAAEAMLTESLRAIEIDPSFTPPYALAARSYLQKLIQGWLTDEARESQEVLDIVERGLRADRRDAAMVGVAGHCFAFFARDLAKGIAHIDEAIALNPNYAHAYLQSGVIRPRAGEAKTAIQHLEHARRLSPRDSRNYAIFQALSLAHHVDGDAVAAYDWARRSVQHNPNYRAGWTSLASSAACIGQIAEARSAASRVIAMQPTFTIRRWARLHPISVPERFAPVLEGFRLAGLPE